MAVRDGVKVLRMSKDEFGRLKLKYKAPIIGALFGGYGVAAALSYVFAAWLAGVLDIPWQAPVREQPHGWLWGLLFGAFFVLAIAALCFGMLALLTRRWARRYGWSRDQARKALLKSELPRDWFRPEAPQRSPASSVPR
jgi:MFS family permease